MVGSGWEMVGVYPTYVLQAGTFLAGTFFLQPLFIQHCFCLYDKTFLLIIKNGATATPTKMGFAAAGSYPYFSWHIHGIWAEGSRPPTPEFLWQK